jgi:hypothetical protein
MPETEEVYIGKLLSKRLLKVRVMLYLYAQMAAVLCKFPSPENYSSEICSMVYNMKYTDKH